MARPTHAIPVRQQLSAAREARGLDRAAAAAATRIPLRYLTMLEEGEYPLVSDPAYLSPYIRRYAEFLGLPAETTVIAFLAENETAERVAAASVTVPLPEPEDEASPRFRPVVLLAMVLAVIGGASAAFVDLPTARGWIEAVRPSLGRWRDSAEQAARSGAAALEGSIAIVREWYRTATDTAPREIAAATPVPPVAEHSAEAAPPIVAAASTVAAPPTVAVPETPPLTVSSPPALATAPAAPTPMQLAGAAMPSEPAPAPPPAAAALGPQRLDLLATARQVFVWVTIDGREQREVELRRGESASFEAKRELVLTLDDAGGVLATLNGKRLPPLGAAGYGRRNIRIPRQE